jgi:hypothetical protein
LRIEGWGVKVGVRIRRQEEEEEEEEGVFERVMCVVDDAEIKRHTQI